MDLYGSGASVAQANSQTQLARQINIANVDFNNSLAEQVDTARTNMAEEQGSVNQKNVVSMTTAGGKLATLAAPAVGAGAKKVGGKLMGRGTEIAASLAETTAREGGEQFVARNALRAAENRTGTVGVFAGEDVFAAAEEEASAFGGEVSDIGRTGLEEGELYSAESSATDIAGDAGRGTAEVVEGIGTSAPAREAAEEALEKGAGAVVKGALKTGAKGAIAGVGGVLDVGQDIARATKEGGISWNTFGSNNYSRIGNIGNIIGSGLEVAGVFMGPVGLAAEAAGAAISLGSAAFETYGDVEAGAKEEETTESDITSQARSQAVAETTETAVGRSN